MLTHYFGRRLRAAGVSFEDRQDLLGHKSAKITTHYSAAELMNLWQAASKVCEENRKLALILMRSPVAQHTRLPQKLRKGDLRVV